jgi:hypothetical protein
MLYTCTLKLCMLGAIHTHTHTHTHTHMHACMYIYARFVTTKLQLKRGEVCIRARRGHEGILRPRNIVYIAISLRW